MGNNYNQHPVTYHMSDEEIPTSNLKQYVLMALYVINMFCAVYLYTDIPDETILENSSNVVLTINCMISIAGALLVFLRR